jgi:hypothetical protein
MPVSRRALALVLILASRSHAEPAKLGEFADPYILETLGTDYSRTPNLGDRKVSFLVGGHARVTVGPQADFDRYWEVLKLVNHKERKYRLAALYDLKEYGTMKAARAITGLLGDPDYEIKETAAWALGEMGFRSAIRPLIDALEYQHGPVRVVIGNSLRKLTGKNFGASYKRWWAWYDLIRKDS